MYYSGMYRDGKTRDLRSIAGDFFNYLGSNLPQQCASDEFYFFPRSEAALNYLNCLDDFTPERIKGHVDYVKQLLMEMPSQELDDQEEEIDRLLVKQSMESFLREFDDAETWRNDPTLYVKIPLFAAAQAVTRTDYTPDQVQEILFNILTQIPSFLSLAIENLRHPSSISIQVATDMTRDALFFFNRDIQACIEERTGKTKELATKNREVLEAWEGYKKGLFQLSSRDSFAVGEDRLKKILEVSFSYSKSPQEILNIALDAFHRTQDRLNELAYKIDKHKHWTGVIYERLPSISSSEVMQLYQKEVKNLRAFLLSQDIIAFPPKEKLAVLRTPFYLESLRATASYQAPLTGDTNGQGIFYITPGSEDLRLIPAHCPYLSAHETYPGHHILDHWRILNANPIRRQIESPLFYEGWACYGEQILDELGYIEDPRQQLIQLKRQLWRCTRAILDVELQTGRISPAQATGKIEILGFPLERAQHQIRRFCLTPGYQLCYFMGTHEIMQLRKRFYSRLGPKTFHEILLNGGEIPFYLVAKRFEAFLQK